MKYCIFGFVEGVGVTLIGFGLWAHSTYEMTAGGITCGLMLWFCLIAGMFDEIL